MRPLLHLDPNLITDRTVSMFGFEMLLQIGLLLLLGPNVITDGTVIKLGSSCYACAFYRFPLEVKKTF